MAGGIFFNNVAQSSLFYNGAEQRECYFNNVLNWKKELQVFPGIPIANAVNIGSYKPYWTYSNDGSKIHVESYGGTDAGDGFIAIGPFSSVGYSQCYFHNLALDVFVNNNVNAKVGLGDINAVSYTHLDTNHRERRGLFCLRHFPDSWRRPFHQKKRACAPWVTAAAVWRDCAIWRHF